MNELNLSKTSQLLPALDRFLEAASVAAKWRKLSPIERRLQRDMARAFRRQGAAFVGGLDAVRHRFSEAATLREAWTEDDWFGIFDDATGDTFQMFLGPIRRAAEAALLLGAEDAIAAISVDWAFNLSNPRAVAYLDEHGAALVRGINSTTRDYIRTVIRDGVDEGWSYDRMAKAITDRYSEFAIGKPQQHIQSRAHLIAVTEAGDAYEASGEIVVQDLADSGIRMEKAWMTVGDARVSPGCRENERAGWIPMAQSFPSGDQRPLRFPGCRCTAIYRRARGGQ